MVPQEQNILKFLKITFLFLFILLGITITSEEFMILVILFYIAFIKR